MYGLKLYSFYKPFVSNTQETIRLCHKEPLQNWCVLRLLWAKALPLTFKPELQNFLDLGQT